MQKYCENLRNIYRFSQGDIQLTYLKVFTFQKVMLE